MQRLLPVTLLLAALLFPVLLVAVPARADHPDVYPVEGGTYRAHIPASWDGRSHLPLLMFFHGYGQNGGLVMDNKALNRLANEQGVLVIAPDGQEMTGDDGRKRTRWSFQGAPMRDQLRNDDVFVAGVLADAKRRWPVDEARVWASGFSIGGSMTWHLACFSGHLFTAYMPIAGAFWRPHPQSCPSGPVNLLHVHGTSDKVVPMTGRAIREIYHQGDVMEGIAFWRDQDGCPAEPSSVTEVADLRCEAWRGCSSGRQVELCLHPGGHKIPTDFLPMAIAWAEGLAKGG